MVYPLDINTYLLEKVSNSQERMENAAEQTPNQKF